MVVVVVAIMHTPCYYCSIPLVVVVGQFLELPHHVLPVVESLIVFVDQFRLLLIRLDWFGLVSFLFVYELGVLAIDDR